MAEDPLGSAFYSFSKGDLAFKRLYISMQAVW